MSNELQNKLSNYEATPSEKVWPAILSALDEKQTTVYEKLFEYQEKPNAAVWNKINKDLDAVPLNKAKIVPLHSNYTKAIKFGFAAAVLVFIAIGISYLFTKNNSSDLAVNNTTTQTALGNENTNNKKEIAEKTTNQPLISSPAVDTEKNTSNNFSKINKSAASLGKLTSNRYTTIENNKGKKVRLSKKVISVFDCADNSKASNNSSCKENIQNLQHKMATSSISASADFGALIDMLKDLKENNN